MLKTMAIMPFAVLRIYIGFAVRNVFRNKFTKSGLICSHLFLKLLYPAFFLLSETNLIHTLQKVIARPPFCCMVKSY